jgi:hypothetical protein
MPGKKPATKDLPSKPPDWVWTIGGAAVVCDVAGAEVGDTVGEAEEGVPFVGDSVGEDVEAEVEEDADSTALHMFPLHV